MPSFPRSLTCACVLIAFLCGGSWATTVHEVDSDCQSLARPCDTLWIVSTRGLSYVNPQFHAQAMRFRVLDESGRWQASDLENFLALDNPAITTVFWIHGNRYSASEAREQGIAIYRTLTSCRSCYSPIRFVTFSWPSERIDTGPIEDLRVKKNRTDSQAYYLAWLIDQIGGHVPVNLAGYSFGARVATGAAHLLGDGMLCGWTLGERVHPDRIPMRAVLLAPALDNHWLIPGHRHGNAMSQLARLTVIYNSCDSALKRYRFLYCRTSDAQALGYTGIAGLASMGTDSSRIQQLDACCYVGKRHSWQNYVQNAAIMSLVRDELLPAE